MDQAFFLLCQMVVKLHFILCVPDSFLVMRQQGVLIGFVLRFIAFKYKLSKYFYLVNNPGFKYHIQFLFIIFIFSFVHNCSCCCCFWSHFQGFQTILTILEMSVSFSKLLVNHSFDSVIFHQMSSGMEQKDQQV